eukprot:1160753-Pelagomonas_calceolata.AAC.6
MLLNLFLTSQPLALFFHPYIHDSSNGKYRRESTGGRTEPQTCTASRQFLVTRGQTGKHMNKVWSAWPLKHNSRKREQKAQASCACANR